MTHRAGESGHAHHGFNGATGEFAVDEFARQPRREDERVLQWGHGGLAGDDLPVGDLAALLVELQWGHGEFAVDETATPKRSDVTTLGFNGATASSPWMT